MSTARFSLIEGSFRVPLMRGLVDERLSKYEHMEQIVSNDLDQWLCNLYFDVRHLPRYMDQQKEYTVEMNFTSKLLRLNRRVDSHGTHSRVRRRRVRGIQARIVSTLTRFFVERNASQVWSPIKKMKTSMKCYYMVGHRRLCWLLTILSNLKRHRLAPVQGE